MQKFEKYHHDIVEKANIKNLRVSPLKAIRAFCLECVGYQVAEVKDCMGEECPLFKFRFGRNMTGRGKK